MTLASRPDEKRVQGFREGAIMTGIIVWVWFIAFGVAAAIYGLPEFFFFALIPLVGSVFGWYIVVNTPE